MMVARGEGVPVDQEAWERTVRLSVQEAVRQQVEAGISVVNDGENSKVSFWGYITDRLTGFEPIRGVPVTYHARYGGQRDERDFPEFFANRPNIDEFARRGRGWNRNVCCSGPIEWKDFGAVEADLRNLKAAIQGRDVEEAFVSSTSPGNVL